MEYRFAAVIGERLRADLARDLRAVPFERSVAITYVVGENVKITNMFYGGRDYEALYRDHPEDEANES